MKKVLILSGSPRKGGNSDILCDQFAKGALEAGNEVEKIRVAEKKIAPCTGCYFCRNSGGRCALNDDMGDILQKIIDCDVLVLSSPVYFYSMCAQLKAVIDRCVARWTEIANKDLYYIMTAAEEDEDTMDGTIACMHGFAMCIDGYDEKGILYGKGVAEKGEVVNRPELMQIAYEMGMSVR
ncbi:MAG: flavodoxin family protein [Clostridiales bacterium]|nr:flavodoxin family protein [Clostridiales bacterium]